MKITVTTNEGKTYTGPMGGFLTDNGFYLQGSDEEERGTGTMFTADELARVVIDLGEE